MTDLGHRKPSDPGQTRVKVGGVTEVKPRLSPSGEVVFSNNEAAAACGVSPETIKRAREAKKIAGAYQETTGRKQWLLPLSGLLAAGFTPQGSTSDPGQRSNTPGVQTQVRPKSEQGSDPGQTQVIDLRVAELEAALAAAHAQLVEARADAKIAEARLDAERQIVGQVEKRAETAERALLMLGTGPTRPEHLSHSYEPPAQEAGGVIHPDGQEPDPQVVQHQPAPRQSLRERIFGSRQ